MRRLHGRARARGPDSRARGPFLTLGPRQHSGPTLSALQTAGAQSERPLGHRRNASWPAHALFGTDQISTIECPRTTSTESPAPRPRRGGCVGAQLARPQHRILSTQMLQYTLLQDAARKRRTLQPFHAPRMVPHCGPMRQALTKRARKPPQRRPTKGGESKRERGPSGAITARIPKHIHGQQGERGPSGAVTARIPKHIHGAKSGQASVKRLACMELLALETLPQGLHTPGPGPRLSPGACSSASAAALPTPTDSHASLAGGQPPPNQEPLTAKSCGHALNAAPRPSTLVPSLGAAQQVPGFTVVYCNMRLLQHAPARREARRAVLINGKRPKARRHRAPGAPRKWAPNALRLHARRARPKGLHGKWQPRQAECADKMLHWSGPATPQQPHPPPEVVMAGTAETKRWRQSKIRMGQSSGACGPAARRGWRNKRPWKRTPLLPGARRRA